MPNGAAVPATSGKLANAVAGLFDHSCEPVAGHFYWLNQTVVNKGVSILSAPWLVRTSKFRMHAPRYVPPCSECPDRFQGAGRTAGSLGRLRAGKCLRAALRAGAAAHRIGTESPCRKVWRCSVFHSFGARLAAPGSGNGDDRNSPERRQKRVGCVSQRCNGGKLQTAQHHKHPLQQARPKKLSRPARTCTSIEFRPPC